MLKRFHLIPERNGQTDGRTDRFAISISRVSMLTRDNKIHGGGIVSRGKETFGCIATDLTENCEIYIPHLYLMPP